MASLSEKLKDWLIIHGRQRRASKWAAEVGVEMTSINENKSGIEYEWWTLTLVSAVGRLKVSFVWDGV